MTGTDLVGKRLGPCLLESVLGSGAAGTVYRGRHLTLDRLVAVKVIADRGGDSLQNWITEARAAARVQDPRVVQIYHADWEGSVGYVVMQLVEGRTLAEVIEASGPLPPERAALIMTEVARGLEAAHRHGVVHRDIKPTNIMLGADGSVKVLDFGVAASIGNDLTAGGTLAFMAPEQARGAAADPRQDLYALGATYLYCLVGRAAEPGFTPSAAALQRLAPLTPFAAHLLERLLDPDPDRRIGSAREVLQSLEAREMLVYVNGSGSPFDLMRPPPAAPTPLPRAVAAPKPRASAAVAMPDPPPAPPLPPRFSPAAGLLLAAVFLWVFGRPWAGLGEADWLGAGLWSALLLWALACSDAAEAARRGAGLLLGLAMVLALLRLGGPGFGQPPLEAFAAAGVGATLALGGLLVCFWGARKDRALGCALLLLAAATLALGGEGRALPAGAGWAQGATERLRAHWDALVSSQGLYRWGGVFAAYAGYRVKKTASC